ncbi:MAG: B12-binding domain-containing radical SAM protein [Candidatus Aminicenantes bacterium]|nr:MAG: B12-binding domain-containing radical SAM protein [Candidatus Aminicenantes bacterium]
MKIQLIEVQRQDAGEAAADWFDANGEKFFCPSLSLPIIASLTDDDVTIIDQKVQPLENLDADLIGVSFKSFSLKAAQDIALKAKKEKIPIAAGGIHASLVPNELLEYFDAVVVGEGEINWKRLLDDFKRNKLQRIYQADELADLTQQPIPRFDLLDNSKYHLHAIQASRGCSLDCEFCPTKQMFGGVFRLKRVKQVVSEIKAVIDIENKKILFCDDIFGAGDKEFIHTLLLEMKKLGLQFIIISDFQVLDDKMIAALADAGCFSICLNMPSTFTAEEVNTVQTIHSAGIDVWGYFMFGFEDQDATIFERVVDFVKKVDMKVLSLTVMAPFPNTPIFNRLQKENRLKTCDWNLYHQNGVVHTPAKMSAEELEQGYQQVRKKLADILGFPNYSTHLKNIE